MTDITITQTAAARKSAYISAVAAFEDAAAESARAAERMARANATARRKLDIWLAAFEVDDESTRRPNVRLTTINCDPAVLAGWETDLVAQGYVVTNVGNEFKVELPPDA